MQTLGKSSHTRCLDNPLFTNSKVHQIFFHGLFISKRKKTKVKTTVLIVKNKILIWNFHHEIDQASISNFKMPGLKIDKRNYS